MKKTKEQIRFNIHQVKNKDSQIELLLRRELWHGYDKARRKPEIKTHKEFCIPKNEYTVEQDKQISNKLESEGWIVLRFLGKEIKIDVAQCADTKGKVVHVYDKY